MSTSTKKEMYRDGGGSVRTTTYETKSSSSYEVDPSTYRSKLTPRNTIIQRTTMSPGGQSQFARQYSKSMQSMGSFGLPSGSYAAVTQTGVGNVVNARTKEKKDMQDLNERFASYIEKVRFLEAQNRKLADELEKLKSKWGKETTAIKAMYQAELDEARRLLDDAEKEKARLEIRCASLEEQIEELQAQNAELNAAKVQDRETIERQNQQLSEYEAEINVLRRRIEQLENDRERDKKEIARLTDALNRARVDLDNETLAHIDAENRRQTLEEEIEFLKQVHEQEMKELAALAYRDTTQENREFWKNEMGNALREIQSTYDEKLDAMRGELETYYNLKIQEFRTGATRQNMETVHSKEEAKRLRAQLTDLRSKLADLEARNAQLEKELELLRREYEEKEREWEAENTELKNEVAKLRAEMEAILKELQDLMDTKLGLELEIAAYRKLLEGEENRVGLRQVVERMITTQDERARSAEQNMSYYIQQSHSSTSQHQHSSASSASALSGGALSGGAMSGGALSGGAMSQQMAMGGGMDMDSSLKVSQVVKGEMSAKTTYQRSAKGTVSVMECDPTGNYIQLENTGRKEENLSGWIISRVVDGSEKARYVFPGGYMLRGSGKVKVFAHGKKNMAPNSSPGDLEASNINSWGIGANIITKLLNPANEDRATHIQKTIYTS